MTWLGVALLVGGVMGIVGSLLLYGLLTPTAKSPARPGDLESRRYFAQQVKLEVGLVGVGVVLLAVGLAVQMT